MFGHPAFTHPAERGGVRYSEHPQTRDDRGGHHDDYETSEQQHDNTRNQGSELPESAPATSSGRLTCQARPHWAQR